jgi:hypothetical protein
MTLSTLREMMRTFAGNDAVDSTGLNGLALIAAEFYDMLCAVRSELGHLTTDSRRMVREKLIVDSATMMQGYAFLMRDYNTDISRIGASRARSEWTKRLSRLSASRQYTYNGWSGDFFDKRSPFWGILGVTRSRPDGKTTVLNTGAARSQCGRALRGLCAYEGSDLSSLVRG